MALFSGVVVQVPVEMIEDTRLSSIVIGGRGRNSLGLELHVTVDP